MRFTECAGVASDETTLVTLPSGDDCCHKGGRLAFGKDGKLYVTLGDEHSVAEDTVGSASSVPQDPNDVRGKILRYEPDGSIPSDNPFGADSPVWVAGLRNPFGLAFDSDGNAFVTSNGPTGDIGTPATGYDLAFRVEAGGRVPVARVLRLLASRTRRDLVPRTERNRSGAARSRRSCRPAQRGSTTAAPTRRRPFRVLQLERHARLHAGLTPRHAARRPEGVPPRREGRARPRPLLLRRDQDLPTRCAMITFAAGRGTEGHE